MKKLIFTILIVFGLMTTYAQSKKEQIAQLTFSCDSLKNVLAKERNSFNAKSNELNAIIQQQKSEIKTRKTEIVRLNRQLDKKQTELIAIHAELDSVNSILVQALDSNQELNSTKMALESKIDLLKNENDSKNDTIESLRQYNQLLISDLNSKADSVEIFKLKKERIIEVNSFYSKIVEDYLIGAINCITKEFAEEKSDLYADVKKCQLEDGFSYKKLDYRQIEQGTTITEYFYKSNLCFFVNVMWMSEGASKFGRLYYDRNGELIQVLSTQFAEMDVENYCYFYTEVSDKEEIKSIINRIASSEKELNRILGD